MDERTVSDFRSRAMDGPDIRTWFLKYLDHALQIDCPYAPGFANVKSCAMD